MADANVHYMSGGMTGFSGNVTGNANDLTIPELVKAIKYFRGRIKALSSDPKKNYIAIDKFNRLVREYEKAREILMKYFKDLAPGAAIQKGDRNSLSINKIHQKDTSIQTVKIENQSRIGSSLAWKSFGYGLGRTLKAIAGTVLTLTGIGAFLGVPLLKKVHEERKLMREGRANALDEEIAAEEFLDKMDSNLDTPTGAIATKANFSQEQIDYLMDHPDKLKELIEEANGTKNNLGLTLSQRAKLRENLSRVQEQIREVGKPTKTESKVDEKAQEIANSTTKIEEIKKATGAGRITDPTHLADLNTRAQYLMTGDESLIPESVTRTAEMNFGTSPVPKDILVIAEYQQAQNTCPYTTRNTDARNDLANVNSAIVAAGITTTSFDLDGLEGEISAEALAPIIAGVADTTKKNNILSAVAQYNSTWKKFEAELQGDLSLPVSDPKHQQAKKYLDARQSYRTARAQFVEDAKKAWASGADLKGVYTRGKEKEYIAELEKINAAKEEMRKQGKTETEIQDAVREMQERNEFFKS